MQELQKLVIASNNAHKIAEIKSILSGFFSSIHSLKEEGIEIDVVEDGLTFEANALKKAREIQKILPDCAILADDSGLELDALDGKPGVHSARYAGEGHDDKANNEKLLQDLSSVPADKRTARFVSVIALCRPGEDDLIARGECAGLIGFSPVGKNGFGYDPLFILKERNCTFAELSEDEKNRVSHRARSLAELRRILANK